MKALPSSTERMYASYECAEVLGVHVRTVRRWIQRGDLLARKKNNEWYVTASDLSDYQRKNPRRP